MTRRLRIAMMAIGVLLMLNGCAPAPLATVQPTKIPTEAPVLAAEAAPTELEITSASSERGISPDPQPVEFSAQDGTSLEGTFYPAAEEGAPIILLMHWARGSQADWTPYAQWLQNRGLMPPDLDVPRMPEDTSLAVFSFNFRGFDEGGSRPAGDPEGWLLDAQAAVDFARQLPGVDPSRLVTIGASIGADGAIDSCGEDVCLGALSISPGGYLGVPYDEAAAQVSPRPVWCLAAEGDGPSIQACQSTVIGKGYVSVIYPGSAHGMDLFSQELDPGVTEVLLGFLTEVLDL